MDILDRMAELIQEMRKSGAEAGLIHNCNVLWSAKTYEEQQALLADMKRFEIHDVELAVIEGTLHIRPKTR